MEDDSQKSRLPIILRHIVLGFDGTTLRLLLVKRPGQALTPWSLVEDFLPEAEHLDVAATRILTEQTGLQRVPIEQVFTADESYPVAGERTVSVVYQGLVNMTDPAVLTLRNHRTDWFHLHALPDLPDEQNRLIAQTLDRFRLKATRQPVGFNLLPLSFTIPQLINLYEALFNAPVDAPTFTRQLLATGLLVAVEPADKSLDVATYQLDEGKQHHQFMVNWSFNTEGDDFLH